MSTARHSGVRPQFPTPPDPVFATLAAWWPPAAKTGAAAKTATWFIHSTVCSTTEKVTNSKLTPLDGTQPQMVTDDYDYSLPEQFDRGKLGLLANKIAELARSKEDDWRSMSSGDHAKISERTLASASHIIIVAVILMERGTPQNQNAHSEMRQLSR
jgi:hypothetical protein